MGTKRKAVPSHIVLQVLTEAGYKCGNPVCRNILAIDIHHMEEVSKGGGNTLANLLALCSYCHDLYHRGTILVESIYAWKLVLVSLSHAFDTAAIDDLLFLKGGWPRSESHVSQRRRDMGHPIIHRLPARERQVETIRSRCWRSDFHYEDVRVVDLYRTLVTQ